MRSLLLAYRRAQFSTQSSKIIFDKILVANRGEIACRIMRTGKKLGIQTVGVFSEADKGSSHSLLADESYCIGKSPSSESYLRMDKIIEVAELSGAQAIHPGYGFLSENHIFADKLRERKIKFIGPSGESMRKMASKAEAKQIMEAAGVPITPGYHGSDQSSMRLFEEAKRIGYPIMIKAEMGGGGKGMRIVDKESDFEEMLESAKRESLKHFADDRVILEKYIKRSRHIEVQVFGDSKGNAVYLFERDCSVQRRHQKILEEAPAPGLSDDQRRQLGEKAVAAAKAVNYEGAGTIEFIWDCDSEQFYFMEMNTRLQVEHPVTEMITNQDLVEWQLQVASGNDLPLNQEQIKINGHAIEARIYAENTENNFMPDVGRLKLFQLPPPRADVRVETGLREGDYISVHYDPMIAKVIAHGATRNEALKKLSQALKEFRVVGVRTNIQFIQRVLDLQIYQSGLSIDTSIISNYRKELFEKDAISTTEIAMAAMFLANAKSNRIEAGTPFAHFITQKLIEAKDFFRNFDQSIQTLRVNGEDCQVSKLSDQFNISLRSESHTGSITESGKNTFNILLNGICHPNVTIVEADGVIHVFHAKQHCALSHKQGSARKESTTESSNELRAPMPCKVSSIPVKIGDKVSKGSTVAILEAMKMEHVLKAQIEGVVSKIYFKEGSLVGENQKLLEIVPSNA